MQTHQHELVDGCIRAALLAWIGGGEDEHKDVAGTGDSSLVTLRGEAVPQRVGKDKPWREEKVASVASAFASPSTLRDDDKDAIAFEADVVVPMFTSSVHQSIPYPPLQCICKHCPPTIVCLGDKAF